MESRCCHHPDREAVGTCCYCNRSLCEECLQTNRQGKSFCRTEDDCLAYQDELSPPGEPQSPVLAYLMDEASLDAQVRRVSEIIEELDELEGILEDSEGTHAPQESPVDSSKQAPPPTHDKRIPGFCACKLVEEADALLHLISLKVGFQRKVFEDSGSSQPLERVTEVEDFIQKQAAPKIRAFGGRVKPFSSLDVSGVLALTETRTV